jgi:signal peptidase II
MRFLKYLVLFITALGLDRWTKWLALSNNVDFQLCPILNFSLMWNRGVSWGLFHGASAHGFYLLTAFIILVTLGLAYYAFYHQFYKQKACIFLEVLVLSGAVSNIIDRFVYGGVIDFIQFHLGDWYFPTFNVADIFVVCGVFGLLINNMRSHEV